MTSDLRIFNTLGHSEQVFVPRVDGKVDMYTCGPTVYKFSHIGNFRTYLMTDFWVRALQYLGYEVTQVRNITDVGHLVDDTSDMGEDKVLAAARAEGKSPEEIADFYTAAFRDDAALLRMLEPTHEPRATEFIEPMIDLVQKLESLGLTYEKDGNVFYDVQKRDGQYPKLSNNTLDQLQAGYRIEPDPDKHHPADFLLWKAGGPRRLQIWDSPWGPGFPGWHLECSAMSLHYFPGGFDIHTGGNDLIFPHHDDEIAQSEPVAGHQVVNYWIHGAHLQLDGRKMAKSSGDIIRASDLQQQGFDPLAFRYLYLSARYRTPLSFSLDVLEAAQRGLNALRQRASQLPPATAVTSDAGNDLEARFVAALRDDLNLPVISALLQDVLKADIDGGQKRTLLERWDQVLQLDIARQPDEVEEAPANVKELAARREEARGDKRWADADRIRTEIDELGWAVEDTPEGPRLLPRR